MSSDEETPPVHITEEEAIDLSIKLWTWLAESGSAYKAGWSGWEQPGCMANDCAMCEYHIQQMQTSQLERVGACQFCPYNRMFGGCMGKDSPYGAWTGALTVGKRKQAASDILQQLRRIKAAQ